MHAKSLQSCPTLWEPMDCSLSGLSVHGIFQARILGSELPFPSPGDLPNPGIEPVSSVSPALQVDVLPAEPPEKLQYTDELLIVTSVSWASVLQSGQLFMLNRIMAIV